MKRGVIFAMAASSGATFTVESCIRGYHVYKDIWDATVREELGCARESDNPEDRYAVAMKKDDKTVGHIPLTMSRLCALFLESFCALLLVPKGTRQICLKEGWNCLAHSLFKAILMLCPRSR